MSRVILLLFFDIEFVKKSYQRLKNIKISNLTPSVFIVEFPKYHNTLETTLSVTWSFNFFDRTNQSFQT